MDEIHNHPTVQNLLKWQARHHWLIAVLALAVVAVGGAWAFDFFFVPRSVF